MSVNFDSMTATGLNFDEFTSGGLHEKHALGTCEPFQHLLKGTGKQLRPTSCSPVAGPT
jgi:hypothetical protein